MAKTKSKARGNGEGTIIKLKNGKWRAVLTMDRDDGGKLKRMTRNASSRAEAVEKLDELKVIRKKGGGRIQPRRSLGEWLDHWIENIAKPRVRQSTYISYEAHVRRNLKPMLGAIPMSKLNSDHIDRWMASMRADPKTAGRMEKAYPVLRRALNVAVKSGAIPESPLNRVDPPKVRANEAEVLTADQSRQLLEATRGDRYHALICLALTSGMRLGELLGLTWPDIDFDRQSVAVRRAQSELNGVVTYGEPKTKAGSRTIALDEMSLEALSLLRQQMFIEGQDMTGSVFVRPSGTPVRRGRLRTDYWYPLCKRLNLPTVKFHALRHTSATLALAHGANMKSVQSRLGHSKIEVTMNVYGHVVEGMDEVTAGIIGGVLSSNPSTKEAAS